MNSLADSLRGSLRTHRSRRFFEVPIKDFLATPRAILYNLGMSSATEIMAAGFLLLLPRQAKMRARLKRPEPMCETVNGMRMALSDIDPYPAPLPLAA